MKTYSAKASEIEKKWVLIDAEGLVVGRLGQSKCRKYGAFLDTVV